MPGAMPFPMPPQMPHPSMSTISFSQNISFNNVMPPEIENMLGTLQNAINDIVINL
jgi:hypothetical protein